ncbi:MAG: glycosyltransferase [Gaiellaceae bacterium]
MRLLVYTDYVYRQVGESVYGERAFASFLGALTSCVDQLTVVGRLDPAEGATHYPLPAAARFVGLPHYESLTRPGAVTASLGRSLRRFWRALDDADRVWLLGPYPHAVVFAVLSLARRRRVILGVRQEFPGYIRSRRPGRRWMHVAADVLESVWRGLARFCPVIVVGPDLAARYGHARRLLEITVSLISSADIAAAEASAPPWNEGGPLRLLSVGRLDHEKNPLLLADVLARLRSADPRWRLVICGEGGLEDALVARLKELDVGDYAELAGYVPFHAGLLELYRSSHVFLHVSLTEGMPQVLVEAFASGVPVVATAVGGVPQAAGDAALLIPPEDADAAVAAIRRLASEADLRRRLVEAGRGAARQHTIESEISRICMFIAG